MTWEQFEQSAAGGGRPPAGLSAPLLALWRDLAGDWDGAHASVQNEGGADAAWVHAYLHRKEGDPGNARYWYARAGRPPASAGLEAEREAIARELLGRGGGA